MEENTKGSMKKTIEKRRIIDENPERKGLLGALKVNEPKMIEKEYEVEIYEEDKAIADVELKTIEQNKLLFGTSEND